MSTPTPLPPLPPPRGRPPTAGLRERILAAAEGVFTARDYHDVLMDDVARGCGVAKGTLYRYFPSKRALCRAVTFAGLEQLRDAVCAAVEASESPLRKLERIVHCIVAYAWDRRPLLALIHRNEYRSADPDSREWERRRTEIAQLVERTIEEAIAARRLRAVQPRIATEMLLGMLRGVTRYRRAQDTREALAASVLDLFVRGAGTRAGQLPADAGERRSAACR
jgi:AcrR family transcriptional regulator